ncbi:MAG: PKD domain-containing protein [Methanomassiliicoccales archaeon]|nr:PKD domain-containing protein [Methanomassiliicoccales archaeon]
MRRLAVAVLLSLFLLSSTLPSLVIVHAEDAVMLEPESSGLGDNQTLFDEFSQTLVIAKGPKDQVVADLNNDSFLDIAIIYSNSQLFDIFFNDGNGTFSYSNWARIDPSTSSAFITDITVGDMDNDTTMDIVVSLNATSNNIVILYQATDFDPASATSFSTSLRPYSLSLRDMDGDMRLDVIVLVTSVPPTYQSGFQVHFYSESYGTLMLPVYLYTAPINMMLPRLMTTGDFDGDGLADIIIGDPMTGKVVGFINGGSTGTVWTATTVFTLTGLTDILLEEIDGTGLPELATSSSSKIELMQYNETSTEFDLFAETAAETDITSIAVTDHDGNALMDIVRTSSQNSNVAIYDTSSPYYYADANLSFPTAYLPTDVMSADMSSDGYFDLIVLASSSSTNGTFTIYYQTAQTVSNANDNQLVDDVDPSISVIGDFNGDGNNEMAAYDGAGFVRFIAEGYPNLHERTVANVTAMCADDLNGDGYDDLVIVMSSPSSVTVLFGAPTFLSGGGSSVNVPCNVSSASSLALGYLESATDDDIDLAIGGLDGVDLFWSSGTGTLYSSAERSTLVLTGANVTSLACGQLSNRIAGDGLMDIAIVNGSASRIEIYYQQTGSTKFVQSDHNYLNVLATIGDVVSSDLNGDGLDDLLTSADGALRLYLQMSSLPNGFSESQTIRVRDISEGLSSFAVGDLDDDGGMEMAVVTENSTVIAYGYSSGYVELTRQTVGASPVLLMLDDMDDDGKDDIVAYSTLSRTISFFYQNNFAPTASGNSVGSGFLEGVPVSFDGTDSTDSVSDNSSLNYTWSFSNGGVAYGDVTAYTFMKNDTYWVTLTVTDQGGLIDSQAPFSVIIGDAGPTAIGNYTCTDPVLTENESAVQFISTNSISYPDEIVEWLWDFDDGSTSTDQNPTHVFADDGTYDVVLTVTDDDGSTDVSNIIQVIVDDTSPTADFDVTTPSPKEGKTVQFDDSSLTPRDAISWHWTFGDGGSSDDQNPAHIYADNGTYVVNLTVTDEDGDKDSYSIQVVIGDTSPTDVSIRTSGGQITFDELDEIVFIVNANTSWDGIVSYSWDFQGTTFMEDVSTSSNFTAHNYTSPGMVRITVRVWDNDSYAQTYIEITIIDPAPDANFTYTISKGLVTLSAVTSLDTENDMPLLQYRWYIEGIWTSWSTDSSANHVFTASGTYSMKLEVKDDSGSVDSMTRSVTIELDGPTIEVIDPDLEVNVSEPIVVRASVSDPSGVSSVVLQYVIGNVTTNVTMTLQGTNVYLGQIPTQAHATKITYRVIATDTLDNENTEGDITITVVEEEPDLTEPSVNIVDLDLQFNVSEPIVIYVNVIDEGGVSTVVLQYVIDTVTTNVTMTLEGDNYFGQIPGQNHTTEIVYRIIATDMSGNQHITDDITIAIVEEESVDQFLFVLISALLLVGLLALMIYLYLSRPIVDEVFVMYHDGMLLAHQTRRMKPGMDDEILGGMLIALQNFVRDSFKDESETMLRRLDFGERKMLVERKDDFFLAVLLSGKRAGWAPQRMQKTLDVINEKYAKELHGWDGDLEKVRGIRDDTKPMFQRGNPLDRLKSKEE